MLSSRVLLLALLVITPALVSGCGLRGSGTPATELREVEAFDKVEIGGAFELVVHVEPGAAQKLELTADDNILPKIETTVSGGELEVDLGDISLVRPKTPIRVEAWVPALTAVNASGASDIEIEGVHGERFELNLSGASDTTLRGVVDRLEVNISGAGELLARELSAKIVEIDVSGSGEAEVTVSESLDVDISGSGEVSYWGSPATVNQDISGSGEIKQRD